MQRVMILPPSPSDLPWMRLQHAFVEAGRCTSDVHRRGAHLCWHRRPSTREARSALPCDPTRAQASYQPPYMQPQLPRSVQTVSPEARLSVGSPSLFFLCSKFMGTAASSASTTSRRRSRRAARAAPIHTGLAHIGCMVTAVVSQAAHREDEAWWACQTCNQNFAGPMRSVLADA